MTAGDANCFDEQPTNSTDIDTTVETPHHVNTSSVSNPEYHRQLSISEQASASSSRRIKPPTFLRWLEIPFRVKNIQTHQYLEEATAHAMDGAARGPINQTGSFVGSAMIRLATLDAGCTSSASCTNSVYGIRPSSILAVGSVIVGITAGISMPFVGALVDHTDHRKVMGAVSAFIITAAVGAQLILSLKTWFVIFILEIIGGYFLIMHQVCTMAYLPDLSHELNEMGHYTARFMMTQYFVQGLYTSTVIVISFTAEMNNVDTAKVAAGCAFPIGVIFLGYSWTFLFRKRPKLREIPEGSNIFTTGFKQLAITTQVVFSQYKALRWFMVALLFSPEAGAGVVLAIAVTFLTIYVQMDVKEIAVVSLTMLFSNIPGAMISKYMCRKINPLNSFRMAEVMFAATNALIASTVTGPERKRLVYFYSALVGVAFGWMFPSQRTLAVALIPKGQETEIMGLISFFGQVVGWLPSFVFTAMNERDISMRWGLSIISFFLMTSFFFTLFCGKFEDAVAAVAHTSEDYLAKVERRNLPGPNRSFVPRFNDEESTKDASHNSAVHAGLEGEEETFSNQDLQEKSRGEEITNLGSDVHSTQEQASGMI